ncbi:glycoside hydrolase family 88/105 protein [Catenovulum sediminis]|uniref:Glycoside hydrolase family 88 protein n=1 Tax=Catenovulum sediminis TaxID=1740262 RepID=A0ABV1RN65_9ALTE|nr:glycoside hydrolase family 88 protein [Catenovulum sediminis]
MLKKYHSAKIFLAVLVTIFVTIKPVAAGTQDKIIPTDKMWGERMALTLMQQSPKAWQMYYYKLLSGPKWDYPYGLVLLSFQKLYEKTGDEVYLEYSKQYVDDMVDAEGNIKNYQIEKFSLDMLNNGKILFLLYEKYGDGRYLKVMHTLRKQLEWQPRTKSGGFWHKKIYPYQMWLDGLYMASAYWAQYADHFGESERSFSDIAHQFILVNNMTRDNKTGLLLHAWDESKLQRWADPETGRSPEVWSRALGWYVMALVDTLEVFPEDHKDRQTLITILNNVSESIVKYQDKSGFWYQVTDKGDEFGNYLETSGTAMFSYAMAKGSRLGYLPKKYHKIALKAFKAIVDHHIEINPTNNELVLIKTVAGTGLGNSPYRPATFKYYVEEAVRPNDAHGLGAFILASVELGM